MQTQTPRYSVTTKLLAITAILAFAIVAPLKKAEAGAIAYALDDITNITLTSGKMNNLTFGRATSSGRAGADLASVANIVNNSDARDPELACQGGGCNGLMQNDFREHGAHLAQSDALIAENRLSAKNDALMNLSMTDRGSATSGNDMTISFTLGALDTVTISFTADPLVKALLDQNAAANSMAEARINVMLSILDDLGTGVFIWEPNGAAGGITGGTELADPFSLNKRVASGEQAFDPMAAAFQARTVQLGQLGAATNYRLFVSMVENADANNVQKVPEPATLLILGPGLVALVLLRRKHKQA